MREIRDFAIPFKKEEEIYWKYYLVPEEVKEETKKEVKKTEKEITEEKPAKTIETEKPRKKQEKKEIKTKPSKQKEIFFNRVKEFLFQKVIEIIEVVDFDKSELVLRVKEMEKEEKIVVYNKKRINDEDIIKASKKATELKLNYVILSFGEVPRKLKELLISTKNLSKIDKIE